MTMANSSPVVVKFDLHVFSQKESSALYSHNDEFAAEREEQCFQGDGFAQRGISLLTGSGFIRKSEIACQSWYIEAI